MVVVVREGSLVGSSPAYASTLLGVGPHSSACMVRPNLLWPSAGASSTLLWVPRGRSGFPPGPSVWVGALHGTWWGGVGVGRGYTVSPSMVRRHLRVTLRVTTSAAASPPPRVRGSPNGVAAWVAPLFCGCHAHYLPGLWPGPACAPGCRVRHRLLSIGPPPKCMATMLTLCRFSISGSLGGGVGLGEGTTWHVVGRGGRGSGEYSFPQHGL